MNVCLQICLGLLPGTLVAFILLIKRRAFCFSRILSVLLLMTGCGTTLFFGVAGLLNDGDLQVQMSEKKMMAFANALAKEGDYDATIEVLEQYSSEYGYDDECRLLNARVAVWEGDYERAYGLYLYLCENTELISADAEEVVFVEEKMRYSASDRVMINYLKSVEEEIENYGYSEEMYEKLKETDEKSVDDIERELRNAIEKQYNISDECMDCAEAVADVSKVYPEITQMDAAQEEDKSVRRYARTFETMEDSAPEYLAMDCVEKARIKAYVLSSEYEKITENLSEEASYHELMIAAELYMSDLVKGSDFSEDYRILDKSNAALIEERLSRIYRENSGELNKQEKKDFKERIDAILVQLDDPVLTAVKEELTEAAEEEIGPDATKLYLELAKVEDYFGNETSTDAYISAAIYSSPECEDDSYVAAMSQIIAVIGNDNESDTENIKNVSEYVENVLDHSLTVSVESIVSPQNQVITEAEEDTYDFVKTTVDYVSRAKSSISIGEIDATDFETITAKVQIDSDYLTDIDDLKDALRIYDCGAEISEFSLEKINYSGSNIMLVCDVSGSMSGSMQDLRDAVVAFVTDRNVNENLAVVTFDDGIVDTRLFGTSDEELISFAESMNTAGGTDMYSAVVKCLNDFTTGTDENNVLILMTDGQDNDPKSAEKIYSEIGGLAKQKGITVYAMGLGVDVDTNYLNTIAGSGNGEFIYVSDSSSLAAFYDMLHAQVYNRYKIEYQAQDTITMTERTMEVVLPDENLRDIKSYSLEDITGEEGGLAADENLSIQGMSPRYVYKGLQDTSVYLKGTGFSEDSQISVKLNGNIDYSVEAVYVDAQTYKITIPASASVGQYHVEITIDGHRKVLQNGFSVIAKCGEKKTVFGPYVFTSAEKIENGTDDYTLRGNVTMNGWLHFKGDVTIVGDLEEGGSIRVRDYSGSYVEYDTTTATGFGQYLANKGIALEIPALLDFTLYNDQEHLYDYDNYMADDISTGALGIFNLLRLDGLVVRLYPNSIGGYYNNAKAELPYQDKIFGGEEKAKELLGFDFKGNMVVTNENLGLVIDTKLESKIDKEFAKSIIFMNLPVFFNGEVGLKINTLSNQYSVEAKMLMNYMDVKESTEAIGAEVAWKEQLKLDSVTFKLKTRNGVKLKTAVPIEMNDFTFGASNISDAVETGEWKRIKLTGSASFTSMKVSEYIPQLKKFVGDFCILSMPETTASICLYPPVMEANAKLKLFDKIQLAEAEVQLGVFNFTDELLQIDGEEVGGVRAKLKTGIMWESENGNMKIDFSGAGEIDAHTRFVGTIYEGTAEMDIKWWLLNFEKKQFGTYAIGFYVTHEGEKQFIVAYKYQDSDGSIKGDFRHIGEKGRWKRNKSGVLS